MSKIDLFSEIILRADLFVSSIVLVKIILPCLLNNREKPSVFLDIVFLTQALLMHTETFEADFFGLKLGYSSWGTAYMYGPRFKRRYQNGPKGI